MTEGKTVPSGRPIAIARTHAIEPRATSGADSVAPATRSNAKNATLTTMALARLAGAHVTGTARRAEQEPVLRQLGAHDVTIGEAIPPSPKYDLILDSVGGRTLGTALAALERGGTCVNFGVSAGHEVTFDVRAFYVAGRTTLYGFYLFQELGSDPASIGLRRLANLVAAGQLTPHISVERSWKDVAKVAQELIDRRFHGKAVLMVD